MEFTRDGRGGHVPGPLFDAPARSDRAGLTWLAHAFLAHTPLDAEERHVVSLLGFAWGFDIDEDGLVTVRPVRALASEAWDQHHDLLAAGYPGWSFVPTPT